MRLVRAQLKPLYVIDLEIPTHFIDSFQGYEHVSMQKTFMRIPYTGPLPPPTIIPAAASTLHGAVSALAEFLRPSASTFDPKTRDISSPRTVLLTGAGISVASGLADYRGEGGTYTLNKTYRPIYYHEFCSNHEARKRYWARSFLGWTNLNRARPNAAHWAVKSLGDMGIVSSVITQSNSLPRRFLTIRALRYLC